MAKDLVFVIPVRHPQSVRNWDIVEQNLAATLASISNQSSHNWECRIVANREAKLPDLPAQCVAIRVDLPCPKLPDPSVDKEQYYDAVRLDKGLRIYAGMKNIPMESHVMVVDFDDFISSQIAEFVSSHRELPGWYIENGYVYAGGNICHIKSKLHKMCGSTHIIKRKLFGALELPDGTPDLTAIKRNLGSHIYIKDDLEQARESLLPLPFKGVIYRIGNPQSTSKSAGLFREMSSFRLLREYPIAFIKTLFNYRLITKKIRLEFLV